MSRAKTNEAKTYRGSCHCGKVQFEATLDLSGGATRCNCSICTKVGGLNVVLKPDALRTVAGTEHLGEYRVGDSPNSRSFCRHCGVHVFGRGDVPSLGGAFASVNVACLDNVELSTLKVGYWDGRHNNWHAGLRDQPWPNLPA